MERILKNIPVIKVKDWAGERLEKYRGVKKAGESWEVSAHPKGISRVLMGGREKLLTELLKERGDEILEGFEEFPIMVKVLDVGRMLSVQVHPSDDDAKLLGEKDRGKAEGWLALSRGTVYLGLKDDDVDFSPSSLNKIEADIFDAFPIPPGLVHTAENIFLLEVSTPSDLTYRLYDPYGRETHAEKGRKCIRKLEVRKTRMRLEMEEFGVEMLTVEQGKGLAFTDDVFNVLVSTDSALKVVDAETEHALILGEYESCLVMPHTKYEVVGSGYFARIFPKKKKKG